MSWLVEVTKFAPASTIVLGKEEESKHVSVFYERPSVAVEFNLKRRRNALKPKNIKKLPDVFAQNETMHALLLCDGITYWDRFLGRRRG